MFQNVNLFIYIINSWGFSYTVLLFSPTERVSDNEWRFMECYEFSGIRLYVLTMGLFPNIQKRRAIFLVGVDHPSFVKMTENHYLDDRLLIPFIESQHDFFSVTLQSTLLFLILPLKYL